VLEGGKHADCHADEHQGRSDPQRPTTRRAAGLMNRREFPQKKAETGDHEAEAHQGEPGPQPSEKGAFTGKPDTGIFRAIGLGPVGLRP
jgi:hypothetical protein